MGTSAISDTYETENGTWRIWRSDVGRWWATRACRFPVVAENAGAHRTVDADDADTLVEVIKAQEEIAASAGL